MHRNQFIILFYIPSSPGPLKRVPGSSCAMGIGPENGSEAIKKAVCCAGVKGVEFDVWLFELQWSSKHSPVPSWNVYSTATPGLGLFLQPAQRFTLGSCCPQGLGVIMLVI